MTGNKFYQHKFSVGNQIKEYLDYKYQKIKGVFKVQHKNKRQLLKRPGQDQLQTSKTVQAGDNVIIVKNFARSSSRSDSRASWRKRQVGRRKGGFDHSQLRGMF